MKRYWLLSIFCMLLVIATVGVVVNSRSFQIRYHLNRMQAAHEAIFATGDRIKGYGSPELFDRRDYHRDCLVELGYYFHAIYPMENIPDDVEGINSALWNLVRTSFPDSPHPTLSRPGNVLEVWDFPSRRAEWEAFVEAHNVADFQERFMEDEED